VDESKTRKRADFYLLDVSRIKELFGLSLAD
jgi:hypothetical protein